MKQLRGPHLHWQTMSENWWFCEETKKVEAPGKTAFKIRPDTDEINLLPFYISNSGHRERSRYIIGGLLIFWSLMKVFWSLMKVKHPRRGLTTRQGMKYCDIYFTFSEEIVTASRIKFVEDEKTQILLGAISISIREIGKKKLRQRASSNLWQTRKPRYGYCSKAVF